MAVAVSKTSKLTDSDATEEEINKGHSSWRFQTDSKLTESDATALITDDAEPSLSPEVVKSPSQFHQ